MAHPPMGFIICFLFLLPSVITALSNCTQQCQTRNDCSAQLICIDGKCNDDPQLGTHVCSSASGGGGGGSSSSSSGSGAQFNGKTETSYCRRPCSTFSDCPGRLICKNGTCIDDLVVGDTACSLSVGSGGGRCSQSGTLTCPGGRIYPTYDCSPTITAATRARLTNNNFSATGVSQCGGRQHNNSEHIVAVSTGWFHAGGLCGKSIRINNANSNNGGGTTTTTTTARVMDECDSWNGCDQESAYQGPCANDIVDASIAVWNDLKLDPDVVGGVASVTWSIL